MTKRPVESITLAQYRALAAKKPRKAGGEREPATGLSTMLKEGWSVTFWPGRGYRLDYYQGATSGWCESEAAAVTAGRAALRVGDESK